MPKAEITGLADSSMIKENFENLSPKNDKHEVE